MQIRKNMLNQTSSAQKLFIYLLCSLVVGCMIDDSLEILILYVRYLSHTWATWLTNTVLTSSYLHSRWICEAEISPSAAVSLFSVTFGFCGRPLLDSLDRQNTLTDRGLIVKLFSQTFLVKCSASLDPDFRCKSGYDNISLALKA